VASWHDLDEPREATGQAYQLPRAPACVSARQIVLNGPSAAVVNVEGKNGAGSWLTLYQGPFTLLPIPLHRRYTMVRAQSGGGAVLFTVQQRFTDDRCCDTGG
jgi:hypothetical protein